VGGGGVDKEVVTVVGCVEETDSRGDSPGEKLMLSPTEEMALLGGSTDER